MFVNDIVSARPALRSCVGDLLFIRFTRQPYTRYRRVINACFRGYRDQSRSTRVCFNVTIVQTRIPVYTTRRPIEYNDLHSSCSTDTMEQETCVQNDFFSLCLSTIDQIHRSGDTGVSIASFPSPHHRYKYCAEMCRYVNYVSAAAYIEKNTDFP